MKQRLSEELFKKDLTPDTATNLPAARRKSRQDSASRVRRPRVSIITPLAIAALVAALALLGSQIWIAAQAEASRYDQQE